MSRGFRVPVQLPTKPRKGLLPLDHRPQLPPTSPSVFRTPVAVRTVKRKDESKVAQLMELDNTLLNAVDLENIEQQAASAREPTSPKNGPSPKAKLKRSLPAEAEPKIVASTPKRRRSSNGGRKIYVLQMSMEAEAPPPAASDDSKNAENDPAARADSSARSRRSATSCDEDNADDDDLLPCGQEMVRNNETLNTDDIIRDKLRTMMGTTARMIATHIPSQVPALGDEVFEVFTNPAICSQYMRLDQSVLEEGENKAELIRSSQTHGDDRRERSARHGSTEDEPAIPHNLSDEQRKLQMNAIERVFADCERTLHDMTNLDPEMEAETIEMAAVEEQRPKLSNTLAAIDWDEEIPQNTGKPRVSSLFLEKGPFYGLPSSVRRILRDFRGIGELYDWQRECLELPAVRERRNLIYALPTSGGKTLVAEILMLREVLCRLHNVIFIVPYVSLAQEKIIALSPFSIELQFLLEEYSGGKGQCPPRKRRKKNTIFVCTIEKGMMLMDSLVEDSRANEIGMIVIDELHMIGEPRRGACLEMLITKVQALRAGIQIVGMSATIGNLGEVARFMLADVYCRDFRPVELQEYVKCGEALYEVRGGQQGAHGARDEQVFGEKRSLRFDDYSDELRRIDPDGIVGLILQVIPTGSCLVFCPTKRMCENLSAMLAKHLPPALAEHRAEEKAKLIKSLADDGSVAPILPQSFRVGVAYHHAGLTQDERRTIEDAFRAGVLSLIVCTSTLAAGVNLPAQRVIIRSPYIGTSFLTLSRYKQMVGRAGRAGFGREKGDSILVCSQRDIPQVCEMLCSPMDLAESSLIEDDRVQFKSLLLSAIGLGICGTRDALQTLASSTLLAQQAERRQLDLHTITDEVIVQLYQGNAIKARHDSCLRNPPNMIVTISTAEAEEPEPEPEEPPFSMFSFGVRHAEETPRPPPPPATFIRVHKDPSQPGKLIKTIERNSQLEVNRLGKAAIRGGFDMEKAVRYYDEMQTLGKRLCVLDEYDLFYLLLLEDGREVHLKIDELITLINQLTSEQQRIAERYGIGNVLMTKILTRRAISDEQMHKMLRFVRVLIVHELWRQTSVQEVAQRYHVNAGSLQTLMNGTAGTAYSLLRMCEEVPELWAFKHLLTGIIERLTHCCKLELMPLMELPSVKLGRAKQLYRAGFTSLASIARAKSKELVERIEHMNYRAANQLILSAKAKLMQEVDALREQAEEYLSQLNR